MSVATSVSYIDISNNEPDSIQARINAKSITIPASVVEIADNSFENSIVESITFMGDSQLKTIGKYAFKNCKFLKSIQIPPSVVEIADEAFLDSSLEEIVFTHESQLKTISKRVFRDCKFLKSITIPDSVTHIESDSFRNSAIEKVLFGENSLCTIIGQNAFRDCRFLKSIEIPSSVLKIEDGTFSGSNIQTIIFADDSKLETIGEYVFDNCKSLESIKIPSSVVAIGYAAFSESAIKEVIFSDDSKLEILSDFIFEKCLSLKSITILASILEIGESAFSESGIEKIIFSDNSNLKTIGNNAFYKARLSKCIKIPESVVMIAESAFSGCDMLEEVILSVNSQLETIGAVAFLECNLLKNFIFPQSLREIGSNAFSLCSLPKSITLLSPSVEFLGDPFTNSGVDEIIFGNGEKTHSTEKHNSFLQLCKEGDFSNCIEYLEHNDVNLSYARNDNPYSIYCTEDAISIAMDTKNVDLITFLIKNKVLMYSNCETRDIKKCFTDDIFERVFFESATVFWYSICSFAMRKMYKFIRKLLELLRSKEYVKEWVNIFKNFHQNTPLQLVTQGDSLDLYHFLIDFDLIKLANLQVDTLEIYYLLASKFGNVEVLKKSLEILPIEDVSIKFTDFLMHAPQDRLYSLTEYTLPYILKNEDPFGVIVEGEYEDNESVKFPETVLSYLAYAQAFDAFKYIIENVPNTQYTPSHLVACSLFRGYSDAKYKENVDVSNFMKLFEYILQDDIRPHVFGEDKEWVGKSIFTCIRYGSSKMCVRLFSYGFDKDDVYIDVISGDQYNSLIRYSLLSYACRFQSLDVVQCLIDMGVSVDGLLPNHTNSRADSDRYGQNCITIADEDGDEGEIQSENRGEDKPMNDNKGDEYGDDADVTNPEKYVFSNMFSTVNAWFEPYFNPYRLNKNQDVEIYYYNSIPFDPSVEDPLERFLKRRPTGYLTLLNVTPLGAAIYVQNVDLVRLLLKNGANPNAKTFSGFPHLFVLGAEEVINLHIDISIESPEVEYPVIGLLNDMEDKKEEKQMEEQEQEKGKKMKMDHKSEDEDVFLSVPETKIAIFQELVNHGVDLFHEQTVRYVTDHMVSREFNIYDLCTHLNYPLGLLKYLQTIPQFCDKIKTHYIDSFRSNIVDLYDNLLLFSLDTVDYMCQNGYIHFEIYKKDNTLYRALKSIVNHNQDLKLVLEKYGFHFAKIIKKKRRL